MKRLILVFILTLGLVLVACSSGTDEGSPTEPPSVPEEVAGEVDGDVVWARMQNSGTMVVGIAADYKPFEFWGTTYQMEGYDVDLIRDIASQLRLNIKLEDTTFPGLGNALRLGEIDVAISALSVTPERAAVADFSYVYYVGEDAVLGRSDQEYNISGRDDLGPFKIGVQTNSVYDAFVRDELIAGGSVQEANLIVFSDIRTAVQALGEGQVDLVMLDLQPAEVFAQAERIEIIAQGLHPQKYAIALPKGSTLLQEEINKALMSLEESGRLAELAEKHLGVDPEHVQPIEPPPDVIPDSDPDGCIDGMALMEDLSLDDEDLESLQQVGPGETFRKGWLVTNSGDCTWDSSYTLVSDGGDEQLADDTISVSVEGTADPGEEYEFWLDLTAPDDPGIFIAFWTMENGDGEMFGHRLPVIVEVAQ